MPLVKLNPDESVLDRLDEVRTYGVYPRCSLHWSRLAESAFAEELFRLRRKIGLIGPVAIYEPDIEITQVQVQEARKTSVPDGLEERNGQLVPARDVHRGMELRSVEFDPRVDPYKGNTDIAVRAHAFMLAKTLDKLIAKLEVEHGKFEGKRTHLKAYCHIPHNRHDTIVNGLRLGDEHPLTYLSFDLLAIPGKSRK